MLNDRQNTSREYFVWEKYITHRPVRAGASKFEGVDAGRQDWDSIALRLNQGSASPDLDCTVSLLLFRSDKFKFPGL